MKKIDFLKTVLGGAAAMLISVSTFGQIPTDYQLFNSNVLNGTAAVHHDSIDYVSVGSTMGYYALPDPVYHPNFNAAGSWSLTTGFTWAWTVPAGVTIDATPALPSPPANYVELVYATAGAYDISVQETASAAMGACAGIPTYLYINVIGLPTGTMAIDYTNLNPAIGPTTWQQIGATAGLAYQICGPQVAQPVSLNFVESTPRHYASYSFQVTREIDWIDGTGAVIAAGNGTEETVANFPLGAGNQLSYKHMTGLSNPVFTENSAGNYTFTFETSALAVLDDGGTPAKSYRTQYTYRVRTADNDGAPIAPTATTTFVSNILAKSDYLTATKRNVGFTNYEVRFIVNPAPVTGPIYYVPNNYSF